MAATIPIIKVEYAKGLVNDNFSIILASCMKNKSLSKNGPRIFMVDLSGVTFIDIASCIYIISFAKQCRINNWYLTFKIPKEKKVIDFWNSWNFINTFNEIVGVDFKTFFSVDEQEILSIEQDTFRTEHITKFSESAKPETLRSAFAFGVEPILSPKSPSLADAFATMWRRREVQDALAHHFGSRSSYFPPKIIFETIYNSTKHADAEVLLTASHSRRLCPERANRKWARDELFTLAIWDNGESLLNTFRTAIVDGINVREDLDFSIDQEYLLNCHELYSSPRFFQDRFSGDAALNNELSHEVLLLSTLFPGTTSKPASLHESRIIDDDQYTRRGMGLHVLLNSVVDVLGGTVSFRTSKYFMHVKSPNERDLREHAVTKDEYEKFPSKYKKVKIIRDPQHMPPFLGNLVLIRA